MSAHTAATPVMPVPTEGSLALMLTLQHESIPLTWPLCVSALHYSILRQLSPSS